MMTAKSEMIQAQEAMAAVLDAKFSNVPEWKAFRAINRALFALETEQVAAPKASVERRIISPTATALPSYVSLTLRAIDEGGQPVTTPKLMEFIAKHRQLGDPEKAKISVTSSLSKDKRIKSIIWEGGRAWWEASKPIPKKETAGA
jgi:hypothetical protein